MSETIYATGKRKTAVARIWLKSGNGQITVNRKSADTYFERETSRMIMRQPLAALWETVGNCGNPPEDDSRLIAAIAILLSAVVWIVIPIGGVVAYLVT